MEKTIDVLTLGDLCVDLVVKSPDVEPEFGQKEKIFQSYSLEMGGSCSIFACQCSKLGLKTVVIGKTGKDSFGTLIRKTMEDSGVDTSFVKIDDAYKTGMSIHLDRTVDRAILTYTGTIDAVEAEDITEDVLMSTRHFHIGSYFLMRKIQSSYPEVLKKLKAFGATISLDTNWDPDETWDSGIENILPYVDIFLPNKEEALLISRKDNLEEAISFLSSKIPIIALKKGKDGAEAYAYGKRYSAPAVEVKMTDAIGAGDSFDGGFVYGYLNGLPLEECLKLACFCGSMNTRAAGGTNGQVWLDDLLCR